METNSKYSICPIRDILSRLSDKWSLLILLTLSRHEKLRFNELQKEIDDISQRMLTMTLRSLETDGLIHRKIFAEVPPRVEYRLTSLGISILEPLNGLVKWAQDNTAKINSARESHIADKSSTQ